MPGILAGVAARTKALATAQTAGGIANALLTDAIAKGAAAHEARRAADAAIAAAASRRYLIRVFVRLPRSDADIEASAHVDASWVAEGDEAVEVSDAVEEGADGAPLAFRTLVVGPLPVTGADPVATVEARIAQWLEKKRSRHTRRVVAMAGGAPLRLHLGGEPLEAGLALLAHPLDSLAGRELRPGPDAAARASGAVGPSGWRTDVPEEAVPSPDEAGEGGEA
jgi:hypothetical protein